MDMQASPTRVVVRGSEPVVSAQGSRYEPGVSAETAGARGLFLGTITLLPGHRTKAHVHHHESAHYMLSGEAVELWTGPRLEQRSVARPGDYLFITAITDPGHRKTGYAAVIPGGQRTSSTAAARNKKQQRQAGVIPGDQYWCSTAAAQVRQQQHQAAATPGGLCAGAKANQFPARSTAAKLTK